MFFYGLAVLMIAQGCESKFESDSENTVNKAVVEALKAKYPDAENIAWREQNSYLIANFSSNITKANKSENHSAWFNKGGDWYMTEIDIMFDQLPEAVKTAFANSEYSTWRVDEVDKIIRNGAEVVYVIEVENNELEVDLYFSPDGVLIKELVDSDKDNNYEDYILDDVSKVIKDFIANKYPNSKILEIDNEGKFVEVEILDNKIKRELLFAENGNWINTKTELRINQVPAQILSALRSSEYSTYRIDDIDHYLTPSEEYYIFELESKNGDVELKINVDGTVSVVNGNSGNIDNSDNTGGSENNNNSGENNTTGLSNNIINFINSKYSGSTIKEYEYDHGYLEVEIFHNNKEKDVRFTASEKWVDTTWDVRYKELPDAVTKAIKSSNYASYEIDDIEFVQEESREYYRIELEKGEKEVVLLVKVDGTIL